MTNCYKQNNIWRARIKLAQNWANNMSKDPKHKVGALLEHSDERQISIGYNGLVSGLEETPENWQQPRKDKFIIHAEMNAILWASFPKKGSTLYCTMQPCVTCLKHAVNVGVEHIIYPLDIIIVNADKHYGSEWEDIAKLVNITRILINDV